MMPMRCWNTYVWKRELPAVALYQISRPARAAGDRPASPA
jgi:hypothetical protein